MTTNEHAVRRSILERVVIRAAAFYAERRRGLCRFTMGNGNVATCAECQAEHGVKPMAGETHGQCERHRAAWVKELSAR